MKEAGFPDPSEGALVTLFLTVADVARSVAFYSDVLGGSVIRKADPATVRLFNAWIVMNPGGGPTPDKPGITLAVPDRADRVSSFLNLRVADIDEYYRLWTRRGATFLTAPIKNVDEVRCYMRDPDGYLIEVGQSIGENSAERDKGR